MKEARRICGRTYKQSIRLAWETGNYRRDGLGDLADTLQRIRNVCWGGPVWLIKFRFPAESKGESGSKI